MATKKKEKSNPETATPNTDETLSWFRILAAKFSVRDPRIQEVLQGLLKTLSHDPASLSKSVLGNEKVELYTELIGGIKVNSGAKRNVLGQMQKAGQQEAKELPPLWVPLAPVLVEWKKRQAERATRQAEADKEAAEMAAKKVEEMKAKAEADKAEADARAKKFAQLVPPAVKAEQAARAESRKAEEAERVRLQELMRPFIEGHGTVDDDRRTTLLSHNGAELEILNAYAMRSTLNGPSGPSQPEHMVKDCVFCGRSETLGKTETAWGRRDDNGKREQYQATVMRQICLKAQSREASGLVRWPDGNPKIFRVCVCRKCGSIAFQLSKSLFTDQKDWCFPQDVLKGYLRWSSNQEAPQAEVSSQLTHTIGESKSRREKGSRRQADSGE
ncbi:hypothetical protein KJ885_01545 [Patescibacteria group bacterium]|nr:hypothetical protein [Patescibacteria group bacterium]